MVTKNKKDQDTTTETRTSYQVIATHPADLTGFTCSVMHFVFHQTLNV